MANTEYILKKRHIPHEIWVQILSFVEPNTSILKCRRVCKTWNRIIENEIWIHKIRRRKPRGYPIKSISEENEFIRNTPWYILYKITSKDDILQRTNLIGKNGWGHYEGTFQWKPSLRRGYNFIRKPFADSDTDISSEMWEDIGENHYYITLKHNRPNYYTKLERFDFPTHHGLTELILDEIKPDIVIGMWACFSPTSEEEFQLQGILSYFHATITSTSSYLTSSGGRNYARKSVENDHLESKKWTKLEIKFSNEYGSKLKGIQFQHHAQGRSDCMKNTGFYIRFQTEKFYKVDWRSIINHKWFTDAAIVPCNSAVSDSHISLQYPWYSNYEMNKKQPFGRNLLPSNIRSTCDSCGDSCIVNRDNFTCSELRTNEWHRCSPHWPKLNRFTKKGSVESIDFYRCKINLRDHGLLNYIRDELQPSIIASYRLDPEDSKTVHFYKLTLSLWNEEERFIASRTVHSNMKTINGMHCIRIKSSGKGERYLVFSLEVYVKSVSYYNIHYRRIAKSCYLGLSF